jgi:hypothetical protein
MSSPNTDKPEDKPVVDPKAAASKDKEEKTEEAPKKGLDYVFKIAPADPKNAFDFEDIADK